MDESEFFQRCKHLAGDLSENSWDSDCMYGFFQIFRPDGSQLRELFLDLPNGAEVYERLMKVFRATVDGFQRENEVDGYFIVRNPKVASDAELLGYANAHLEIAKVIAEEMGNEDLLLQLTPIPHIEIRRTVPPDKDPSDFDSLDTFLYDSQCDWCGELLANGPQADWMQEAFYAIACDYRLSNYLMWPWYRNAASIEEPFEHAFQLWLHGAELRCESSEDVVLFLPQGAKESLH